MQLKNSVQNSNLEIQLRNTVETVEKYRNAAECMQSTHIIMEHNWPSLWNRISSNLTTVAGFLLPKVG